jgi:NTE family protein
MDRNEFVVTEDDRESAAAESPGRVGLVLSGGGARGAYEMGVLSVLLPELAARGERVSVIVGTSVGGLNGAWLASKAHLDVESIVRQGVGLWRRIQWEDVFAPFWSLRSLRPPARYVLGLLGRPARLDYVLDSTPLAATVERELDTRQLAANVTSGRMLSVAVVATRAATGRSVVFHTGGPTVPADEFRGIDYVRHSLTHEHIRASAAVPAAFRPVEVTSPADARGWYVDGGTRLNTPIKPALKLGAERVIVVALNTTRARATAVADERCPDVFDGLGQLMQAALSDPVTHDVRTLATINALAGHGDSSQELVPYILIAPKVRDRIGEIARDVFAAYYASRRRLLTSIGTLGRLVYADAGPSNGELLSYLFFAHEFSEALITEGADDARAWLREQHDEDIWQHQPLN